MDQTRHLKPVWRSWGRTTHIKIINRLFKTIDSARTTRSKHCHTSNDVRSMRLLRDSAVSRAIGLYVERRTTPSAGELIEKATIVSSEMLAITLRRANFTKVV
jgi:hypothetical protein